MSRQPSYISSDDSDVSSINNDSSADDSLSALSSALTSPSLAPLKMTNMTLDDFALYTNSSASNRVVTYSSNIIRKEALALLALANRIEEQGDTQTHFLNIVENLSNLPSHGTVHVTGIGKSGIAARKMVATMNSLGIRASFLHPVEALHGDLGIVCNCSNQCDALLLVSHSGATAELMRLLPIVRPRLKYTVAVTRDGSSVLAKSCHAWLDAGTGSLDKISPEILSELPGTFSDEADGHLPAPTSSVLCSLSVTDALALTLSRKKLGWHADGKARRHAFFRHHPGGQLGIELAREE